MLPKKLVTTFPSQETLGFSLRCCVVFFFLFFWCAFESREHVVLKIYIEFHFNDYFILKIKIDFLFSDIYFDER